MCYDHVINSCFKNILNKTGYLLTSMKWCQIFLTVFLSLSTDCCGACSLFSPDACRDEDIQNMKTKLDPKPYSLALGAFNHINSILLLPKVKIVLPCEHNFVLTWEPIIKEPHLSKPILINDVPVSWSSLISSHL